MPTEITIKAYKYSELDGRAKEKAEDWTDLIDDKGNNQ